MVAPVQGVPDRGRGELDRGYPHPECLYIIPNGPGLTAVCTVIDPLDRRCMLLAGTTSAPGQVWHMMPWFNRTANRCQASKHRDSSTEVSEDYAYLFSTQRPGLSFCLVQPVKISHP
jgi:hypothetical protein